MSLETNVTESIQNALDARLDAIDQVLIGFVGRAERLAIVRELELRLRRAALNASVDTPTLTVAEVDSLVGVHRSSNCLPGASTPAATHSGLTHGGHGAGRRSKLALGSGILGIVAFGLFMGLPIVYFLMSFIGEMLDEIGVILTASTYITALLVGSGSAIFLGLIALWRTRREPVGAGRGWAIAGLCAGPIPFATACLLTLVWGLPMLASIGFSFGSATYMPAPVSESTADSTTNVAAAPPSRFALPADSQYGGLVVGCDCDSTVCRQQISGDSQASGNYAFYPLESSCPVYATPLATEPKSQPCPATCAAAVRVAVATKPPGSDSSSPATTGSGDAPSRNTAEERPAQVPSPDAASPTDPFD